MNDIKTEPTELPTDPILEVIRRFRGDGTYNITDRAREKYAALIARVQKRERENADYESSIEQMSDRITELEVQQKDRFDEELEQARRETWAFCGKCLKEGGVSIDFPSYDDAMEAYNFGKSIAQRAQAKE